MKIFGVGLSRTGTTSLAEALSILGWQTKHFPKLRLPLEGGRLGIAPEELVEYEAFCDTPVAACYRDLDAAYPGSLFILTTRSLDEWLASCAAYPRFRPHVALPPAFQALRQAIYGGLHYDEARFAKSYRRHVANVEAHFAGRGCLLHMDICGGEGWSKLCTFLGTAVPSVAFPHRNRRQRTDVR